MNKKAGLELETIGKMLLIFFFLITLLIVLPQLLFGANKSIIKTIDGWLELGFFSEKDLTSINEIAKKNFDVLMNEINTCSKSTNKECKCKTSKGFNDFSSIHELQITDKTKLVYIKDKNELTMTESNTIVKCYYKTNTRYLTGQVKIKFDDNVYFEDSNNENEDFISNSKDILYKNNNNEICWLVSNINKNYC